MSNRYNYITRGFAYLLAVAVIVGLVKADNNSSFSEFKDLNKIAYIIENRYAEPINSDSLIRAGINGMLISLDPYCRYLTDEDFTDFIDDTYGKFEGIGVEVDMRSNALTIISVLEGTPAYNAGLKPGDRIIAINGRLTADLSREEAARLMRGDMGTPLDLTIRHYNSSELINYSLKRETVETKSIPFYNILPDGIGYIRLTRFSETTYYEMLEALTSIMNRNPRGIILDLRSNSGGLLIEAVKVASLFLENGRIIVETKGRGKNSTEHFSRNDVVKCLDIPLAVLTDGGTASAAEIVAGAIQDWDRGVIIGSPSYGKGLVQKILRLDEHSALKLTTAKYYIPSGRCIQKPENAGRLDVSQGLATFPAGGSSPSEYHTFAGRMVAGGGGIKPDIYVAPHPEAEIVKALKRKSMFFNFALKYLSENMKVVDSNFVADDDVYMEFKSFLNNKMFNYTPTFEKYFDSLNTSLPKRNIPPSIKMAVSDLKAKLDSLKFQRLDSNSESIKWALTEEIMVLKYGNSARYGVVWTESHPEILEARRILKSKDLYKNAFYAGLK